MQRTFGQVSVPGFRSVVRLGLVLGLWGFAWGAVGCSLPEAGMGSAVGREALLRDAKDALSVGDCVEAVNSIEPLYQSEYSNNEIRELRAAAHACKAGMPSILSFLMKIVENAAMIVEPGGLWKVLAGLAYDDDTDEVARKYTSAFEASDALRTVLIQDQVIALPNQILHDINNPASTLITDREPNAILYSLFVSMNTVGLLENAFGVPDGETLIPSQVLGARGASDTVGWADLANVDETACGFGAEVVTLIDSIYGASTVLPEEVGGTLQTVATLYGNLINSACANACDSDPAAGVAGCDYGSSVCAGTAERPCLMALRNRNLCKTDDDTSQVDDYARCAAAGIAEFISTTPILGWNSLVGGP